MADTAADVLIDALHDWDAKLDGQPVLALTALPYHDLIGTHTQQDVELDKVFADVATNNVRVMGPEHAIALPVDLQDHPVENNGSWRSPRGSETHRGAFQARRTSIVASLHTGAPWK
jgi:hypothetical protein